MYNSFFFLALLKQLLLHRVKRVFFKTLVDEVQELEALSKDPGAVVQGKRYERPLVHLPASFGIRIVIEIAAA